MTARTSKHLHGAAWLVYVKKVLTDNNIIPEVLGSGALRLSNGGARITTAELRYIDAQDLDDLVRGRSN